MTLNEKYNDILGIIKSFPEGASSEDIRKALNLPVSQLRTIQRRLGILVKENRLLVKDLPFETL